MPFWFIGVLWFSNWETCIEDSEVSVKEIIKNYIDIFFKKNILPIFKA